MSRSSVMPSLTERSRASGCGRRVSLKRRTSAEWLASRKISVGFKFGCRAQLSEDTRETAREIPSRGRRRRSPPSPARVASARRQLRHRRNELRRQVVDAEVAEIFERADRLRLPGPGESRQDDESPRAPTRPPAARHGTAPPVARVTRVLPCSTSSSDVDVRRGSPSRAASRRADRRDRAPRSGPRVRSSWLRAATSTSTPRLRPGATGMRISGTFKPRMS